MYHHITLFKIKPELTKYRFWRNHIDIFFFHSSLYSCTELAWKAVLHLFTSGIIFNLHLAAWCLHLMGTIWQQVIDTITVKQWSLLLGLETPIIAFFLAFLSWKVLTSAGLGHSWTAVSSGVAAFSSSWRDGRVPACTICAPDISF